MHMHLQRRGPTRQRVGKLIYASFNNIRVALATKAKWNKGEDTAIPGCVMKGDRWPLSNASRLDFDTGRTSEEKAAHAAHARLLAAASLEDSHRSKACPTA